MKKLRELRTLENEDFVSYFEIVRARAAELGCIYFEDSGEGREFYDDPIEGEDLSGFLIPYEEADEFEALWVEGNVSKITDEWNKHFAFVNWGKTECGYDVKFEFYEQW